MKRKSVSSDNEKCNKKDSKQKMIEPPKAGFFSFLQTTEVRHNSTKAV
jgi:hypothetical protein